MAKRALLVGCNYPGTEAELNGCVNDVMTMNSLLTSRWGFADSDIIIQIDTDPSFTKPTGKNIRAALNQLVAQTKPGDVLFFHFSGHGTQLPQRGSDYELDGKDEAICPTDMNLIVDDDLRTIFGKLPHGANFTMVSDCCHSGGMLDHETVVISGQKTGGSSSGGGLGGILLGSAAKALGGTRSLGAKAGGVGAMLAMGTAQLAGLVKADGFQNRSLPVDIISQILSAQSGKPVNPNNLVASLSTMFGADGPSGLLGKVASAMLKPGAADGSSGGGGIPPWLTSAASSMLSGGGGASSGGGGAGALAGLMGMMGGGGAAAAAPAAAEPSLPSVHNGKLDEDVGILVTGCQSSETSADACPSGDPKKAFGALTNAIKTVLLQHNGENITNRQLVAEVRAFLAKGKFTQNPCLECSSGNADKPFMCPVVY